MNGQLPDVQPASVYAENPELASLPAAMALPGGTVLHLWLAQGESPNGQTEPVCVLDVLAADGRSTRLVLDVDSILGTGALLHAAAVQMGLDFGADEPAEGVVP